MVILEATVNESGEVTNVIVLRSIPLLDKASITAVKQWRYEPLLLNGVPGPFILTVTLTFAVPTEILELASARDVLPRNVTEVLFRFRIHANVQGGIVRRRSEKISTRTIIARRSAACHPSLRAAAARNPEASAVPRRTHRGW